MPRAASLAEAIKKASDLESKLVRSGGGVFEVRVDGEVIFSKRDTHRFPEPDEIVELVKSRCPSPSSRPLQKGRNR